MASAISSEAVPRLPARNAVIPVPTHQPASGRGLSTVPTQVRSQTTAGASPSSSIASTQTVSQASPRSMRSTPSILSTPTASCTRPHARRLPFDDECPICQEGDLLSQSESSEVVWCRSTCGRTMHKTCLEDWRAQCNVDGRSFACPVCRGDWDEGPGCGACDAIQVRRRPIEGDCGICCHGLKGSEQDDREELIWCRNSCGQSVHQECFDSWREHCVANARSVTCVACRASWRELDG
jgi:hypothetical protein